MSCVTWSVTVTVSCYVLVHLVSDTVTVSCYVLCHLVCNSDGILLCPVSPGL